MRYRCKECGGEGWTLFTRISREWQAVADYDRRSDMYLWRDKPFEGVLFYCDGPAYHLHLPSEHYVTTPLGVRFTDEALMENLL